MDSQDKDFPKSRQLNQILRAALQIGIIVFIIGYDSVCLYAEFNYLIYNS